MPRARDKSKIFTTAKQVEQIREPGMWRDAGGAIAGLYLQVTKSSKEGNRSGVAKSWLLRYKLSGSKSRYMGLGSFPTFGLAEVRERARMQRQLVADKVDPIQHREAERARSAIADALDAAKAMTFRQCAEACIAAKSPQWQNAKHAAQWTSTLDTYAYPFFGDTPVQAVDTGLVLKALEPIWTTKAETADRVRGRIESVLNFAMARGYREKGANPAQWRGHLDLILSKRSKAKRNGKHHPALPYARAAEFMAELHGAVGTAARALEFLILTAVRTGDVIGQQRENRPPMRWEHVDLVQRTWTIPATKTESEHCVPLPDAAMAILEALPHRQGIVFPSDGSDRPLSSMAFLAVIRRINHVRRKAGLSPWVDPKQGNRGVVTHGFRSTFRDWAGDQTHFPRDLIEFALAHTIDAKTEAAYRRSNALEKRRQLMTAWAAHCARPTGDDKVVVLARGGGR